MMVLDGKQYRYKGTIPWTMSPWASVNLDAGFLELDQMCKSVPLVAPWEAPKANKWDSITLAHWLRRAVASRAARELLETAVAGCYTSAPSEVSMLFVAYQMASGGGPGFVLGGKDASQDARPTGGMGAVYRPMAAEIGDSLHLGQPVHRIIQDAQGVTVCSDDMTVYARRAVVAVPLAIASHIDYEPMLPVDRSRVSTASSTRRHVGRRCWPISPTGSAKKLAARSISSSRTGVSSAIRVVGC